MKKKLLLLMLFCSCNLIFGQDFTMNINNKGNRLQTYPKVTEINPEILDMINQVSIPNLENDIRWMQDLGCRDANSQEAVQTQNWLVDRFEGYGLETYIHFFSCLESYWGYCTEQLCNGDTLEAGNVVAIQYGTKYPDEIILVTSHYDHPDGPGADDNASGTAGVLETARILSQYEFDRTIMYVPFNAEEYWMVGSMPFAQKCAMEDLNILGVFNYDMIGFFPEEMGPITMSSGSSPISERLWEHFYTVANIYVPDVPTFRFSEGDSYGGDHMPFNIYEYPALYIGDTEYHHLHPCYHKLCDTIGAGVNSFELAQAFVKATTAAVVELASGFLPPQNFSAIPSEDNIYLSWDEIDDVSIYKLFRNDEMITELTENFYTDNDVEQNIEYEYYVIGVRNDGLESAESNRDMLKTSLSLNIPYNNIFEDESDLEDFWFPNTDWIITTAIPYAGNSCMTCTGTGTDNCLSIAELNWFQIHDSITDINLEFYYRGNIRGIWYNASFFVEATTDRKKWDKLLKICYDSYPSWTLFRLSLNEYIGNDFVQIRFRVESSGEDRAIGSKRIYLDNLSINFSSPGVSVETYQTLKLKDLKIYPNPAKENVIINTGLENEYNVAIYNNIGNKIQGINNFSDGELGVNHLKPGMYYFVITTGNDRIAKKIAVMW